MSEAALPAATAERDTSRRRHWLVEGAYRALGRWSARIGAAWVLIVGGLAVFAPFVANSHPYLATIDGKTTSPLLLHLSAADVTLLFVFAAGAVLLCIRRIPAGIRLMVFTAAIGLTCAASLLLVDPPELVVYSQYRVATEEGRVESAVFAPIPFSPNDRLRDMTELVHPLPPDTTHWLGTDRFGADIASRMIHACRIALAIGFIAESIALVVGVILGGLMGYFAGLVDLLGLRLVEIFSAIPRLFLLLAFVAFFGRNIYLIMVIIGITGWTGYAYFTRAEFLRLRREDFVTAARACALPTRSILFRHMLPNGLAPILVSAGFGVASAILYESTLSFLGLGVVDAPSWGDLLNQAVAAGGGFYWWLATSPGLAIFLTVFAFNLVGEALRDALDPKTQRASE